MPNRRGILKGGLAVLGGLVGAGTAGRHLLARPSTEAPAGVPAGRSTTLELFGSHWNIASRNLVRGQLPRAGDRMTARGVLLDRRGGTEIGEFYATYMGLFDPGHDGPGGVTSFEQHTFRLLDGSIVGTGVGSRDYDQEDVFAIVGGTGRYAGVRGSYVAVQRHRELGGDGTAEFRMTMLLEGEGHGAG